RRGALPERERQHQAVVVVGVLTDQVDPAWRGPHAAGTAPMREPECRDRPLGSRHRRCARTACSTWGASSAVLTSPVTGMSAPSVEWPILTVLPGITPTDFSSAIMSGSS